jgi:hypothetical protein
VIVSVRPCFFHVLVAAIGIASAAFGTSEPGDVARIDFNRDIRPHLSDKCYQCHGPDSASRKAGLRLDRREDALAVLVPGDPLASELVARITAADPGERMPPAESTKTLDEGEVALLRRWIAEGAAWQVHWSFIAPERPVVPTVAHGDAVRNPIDAFVIARLEQEGLAPSPPADRATLARRLALDLVGLPLSPERVDAFVADDAPRAQERLVDELLASDQHGEHMARYWLDAARYADTHGLHLDIRREMWPWRDWVVRAFNANMPYDQFTIEQLAGDLLPEPTHEQRIATGFNRNHVTTSEGGAIDAEYLVKYAADRVETTATVWMGLTFGCAHCHDHKFDPISQREYFEFFAYFNNTTERAMDGNRKDPPPVLRAPTATDARRLADLQAQIADLEAQLEAPMPELDDAQVAWERAWRDATPDRWSVLRPVEATSTGGTTLRTLDDGSVLATGDNPDRDVYELVARTDRTGLRLLRLEALVHGELPHTGPGRAANANFVLSEIEVEIAPVSDPESRVPLAMVSASADHEQMNGPYPVSAALDGVVDDTNGWAVEGYARREDRMAVFVSAEPFGFEGGTELRIRLRFETHFKQHAIGRARIAVADDPVLTASLEPARRSTWHVVGPFAANDGREAFKLPFGPEHEPGDVDLDASYRDGELAWTPRPGLADGTVHQLDGTSCATYLYRRIEAPTPRRMGVSLGSDDGIKVWLNGLLVHANDVARPVAADQDRVDLDLEEGTNHLLVKISNLGGGYGFYFRPVREGDGGALLRIARLLDQPDEAPDDEQRAVIRRFFRRHRAAPLRELHDALRARRAEEAAFESTVPTTLVMQERADRRSTYVLERGEYDQPRERVEPNVPAVLPRLPEGAPPNRLGLAMWLVDPRHPLTARVTVNRLWQQLFGVGLVRTAEDFGSQGEWPSHPRLLDWLACELIDSGWDLQHMLRIIVDSGTYRQTSRRTPALQARDPENRLLARGPRYRLEAEVIRDQALAASGLLVDRVGGPPVRPYQPSGLWRAVAYTDSNTRAFMKDEGDAQYRRSIYTFWKRTSPPPNLAAFDAPNRETCTVRRPLTNTPLQALVLLNDPQFVEAARVLAQRAGAERSSTPERIERMFRLVLGRRPRADELSLLVELHAAQRERFASEPDAATALLAVGDAPRDTTIDDVELAALASVASVVLGIDETVTKG